MYTLYIPWNIKTNRVWWKFIERYFLCWILAMKTCSPVNFYSVQISPNTSPAHRFHWRAAQFCTRGAGGICRNSQIGPRRSSGGPPLMIIVVPAALGLDHHVCLLAIVEHQVRPEKASKDKKLAFFLSCQRLGTCLEIGKSPTQMS